MIYKHVEGSWSAVKERDVDGLEDAISSPFTVEVWAMPRRSCLVEKEVDELLEKYKSTCEESEEVNTECEELWHRIEKLEEEKQKLQELEWLIYDKVVNEVKKCRDDDCVREVLQRHGFTRVK